MVTDEWQESNVTVTVHTLRQGATSRRNITKSEEGLGGVGGGQECVEEMATGGGDWMVTGGQRLSRGGNGGGSLLAQTQSPQRSQGGEEPR